VADDDDDCLMVRCFIWGTTQNFLLRGLVSYLPFHLLFYNMEGETHKESAALYVL